MLYVAITGANGRIGRTAVETLTHAGHRVRAIDLTTPEHHDAIRADARDYPRFLDAIKGTDALVHLAGIPDPNGHDGHIVHNTNVTASYNALAAAVEASIGIVCLASSINAIGGAFSRRARYDYFPVDEHHPTYNEDPYSLSKWIAEAQADSITRRHADLTVASLRIHGAWPNRQAAVDLARDTDPDLLINHLWGYVRRDSVAHAILLSLSPSWTGHEVFNIVAPDTISTTPSRELAHQHWPDVPLRTALDGTSGFYDCAKAERLLGWTHPPTRGSGGQKG